jgi:hypothetical protein
MNDIMDSGIVSHLLSVLLGFATSFFVWWLLNHRWIPEVTFASELAMLEIDAENAIYLSAFENSGRRDVLDVSVLTRIGVRNFNGARGWIFFSIKTNANQIPVLPPHRRALVRVFDERDGLEFVDSPPKGLRLELEKCSSLKDIFNICPQVKLQIHVFGYDRFSGARRHYASPSYSKFNVRKGRYKGLLVVGNN